MAKIKEKLHKDNGIEISKIYIHSKYEENIILMWFVRVLVIFMGTYGAVMSFISGYAIDCDTELITWVCVIGALLFGTLYGFKNASKWVFIVSITLFLLLAFLVSAQVYAFIAELWNECAKFLEFKNIKVLKMSAVDLFPYDKSFMWGLLSFIIATIIGFFTFCRAHFIPVFLVTFIPLELVLFYGLAPDMFTVVCFFCCNAVALALWLHKFKSRHYSDLNLHLKGTGVISLILCCFFAVGLVLSNIALVVTNYQRPEFFDDLRNGMYMHEAENSPDIKSKTKDLDDLGNREFDFDDQLKVVMPYSEGTTYLKGHTGSYYFADSWYDFDSDVYKTFPVNTMVEDNVSIADVFATKEEGKSSLAFMTILPLVAFDTIFVPYGFYNDGKMTVDFDKSATLSPSDSNGYTLSYDSRTNNLWAEFCADTKFTRQVQDGQYSSLADAYTPFAEKYYTQVPDNMEQVKKLTEQLVDPVNSKADIVDVVNTIKEYLEENTEYTIKPGKTPADKNFVDYFLFENQKGYCVHYATTATLMFRSAGIPARFAEGYVVTEKEFKECDDFGKEKYMATYMEDYKAQKKEVELVTYNIDLRDTNAHAWVEIYIDGLGWVPVEVTPGYRQSTIALGDLSKKQEPTTEPTTAPTTSASTQPTTQKPTEPEVVEEEKPNGVSGFVLITVFAVIALILLGDVITRFIVIKVRLKSFKSKRNSRNVERLYAYLEKILSHSDVKALEKDNLTDGFEKLFKAFDYVDYQQSKEVVAILNKLFYGKKQISDQEVVMVEKFVLGFVKKYMNEQTSFKRFMYKYIYFLI